MTIMSTSKAAEMLQCSHDTVLRLIQLGTLPASRLTPTGRWRIRQQDLDEYAKQHGLQLLADESAEEK